MTAYAAVMAHVEDAAALALALPGVTEGTSYGHRAWLLGRARFAWERPFSKADLKRFGDAPVPQRPILAVLVDDLSEKQALLTAQPGAVFTIEHFADYPAVLICLDLVPRSVLAELIRDAYLSVAPPDVVERFRG